MYLYINSKVIVLGVGYGYESINEHIDADIYTKFETNSGDVDGYMLKYNDYNILLNDALGKYNKVADNAIHTWKSEEYVNIDIYPDEMKIWCTSNDLGIYQSDGYPKYYSSVIAKHNEDGYGGITVTGSETVAGERMDHIPDVQKKEDEDEDEEGQSKD